MILNSKVKLRKIKFGSEKNNTFPERKRAKKETEKQKKQTHENRKKIELRSLKKLRYSIFTIPKQYMALRLFKIQVFLFGHFW